MLGLALPVLVGVRWESGMHSLRIGYEGGVRTTLACGNCPVLMVPWRWEETPVFAAPSLWVGS